jgi:hypothetical protein
MVNSMCQTDPSQVCIKIYWSMLQIYCVSLHTFWLIFFILSSLLCTINSDRSAKSDWPLACSWLLAWNKNIFTMFRNERVETLDKKQNKK